MSFPVCKKGKRKILLCLEPVGAKAVLQNYYFFFPASKVEVKAMPFRKQHYGVVLK